MAWVPNSRVSIEGRWGRRCHGNVVSFFLFQRFLPFESCRIVYLTSRLLSFFFPLPSPFTKKNPFESFQSKLEFLVLSLLLAEKNAWLNSAAQATTVTSHWLKNFE